jgi:hypothetical protein
MTGTADRLAKDVKLKIEGFPFLENIEITDENHERMRGWITDRIFEHLGTEYEEAINIANRIVFEALSRHKLEERRS